MQPTAPKPQPDNEVPGTKGLPLVGNLPQFQWQPFAILIKAAREGGDVVRITLGSQRYYLLSNPDHVRHVLQDNKKNHVKGYGNAHLRVSTA
ncbi:MAG TPA: cytochrome P450 [Rubrobacteraceae bacterium]|nr:cytochrome P450 [Rubrobacteraceae bacterium]